MKIKYLVGLGEVMKVADAVKEDLVNWEWIVNDEVK
jgi:hypothetical protein